MVAHNQSGVPMHSTRFTEYTAPRQTKPVVVSSARIVTLAHPEAWTANAKCATRSFTDMEEYDRDRVTAKEAAEMCFGCPVLQQCLAVAMEEEGSVSHTHRYGVRGGLNRMDRAALSPKKEWVFCRRDHPYEPENIYMNAGIERCRACRHRTNVEYRARKKLAS